MNYNSNIFNSLLPNNIYSSIYDINNNVNKLLINYLISNKALKDSNIINENTLLSLALQNNILNNIISINYIHNINNKINLNDINFCTNINNYNNIRNFNNENNIDKVKVNDENCLFNNIGKKDINTNKNDFIFCSDKQLNKINNKNNNEENSANNNIFN
jgi:hypothetical protein